jgi:hypothetical protein
VYYSLELICYIFLLACQVSCCLQRWSGPSFWAHTKWVSKNFFNRNLSVSLSVICFIVPLHYSLHYISILLDCFLSHRPCYFLVARRVTFYNAYLVNFGNCIKIFLKKIVQMEKFACGLWWYLDFYLLQCFTSPYLHESVKHGWVVLVECGVGSFVVVIEKGLASCGLEAKSSRFHM